jgi:GNAT superfamily N-acetyltransferase
VASSTILTAGDLDVEVRTAVVDDVPRLLSFIHAMAAFEHLEVTATEESLRAALFGDNPAARVLLAFVDGEPIAYVTYFFTFGTMSGKRGLWLDDLFIVPEFRRKGIGQALMKHLATIAVEHDCGRFEWMVLEWNDRAIRLYERLGAQFLADWRVCRLNEAETKRLAAVEGTVDESIP